MLVVFWYSFNCWYLVCTASDTDIKQLPNIPKFWLFSYILSTADIWSAQHQIQISNNCLIFQNVGCFLIFFQLLILWHANWDMGMILDNEDELPAACLISAWVKSGKSWKTRAVGQWFGFTSQSHTYVQGGYRNWGGIWTVCYMNDKCVVCEKTLYGLLNYLVQGGYY